MANQEDYFRHQQNGGFQSFPNRTTSRFLAKADDVKTRPIVVKAGQVLKALSFVKSDSEGKMVAGGNLAEYAQIAFSGTVASGHTVIIGGLTLTASASMTAAEVVTAFVTQKTTKGAFTGTLAGWELTAVPNSTTTLWAYSTTALTNVTDFAITGTHGSLTHSITTVAGSSTFQKPAGILAFDVDASAGDTPASMYYEAAVWADALVWGVDTSRAVVVKADGTTVACTPYNTGAGTALLKQMYVEGTELEIVIPSAGEALQHG